jgi:hypothetical protein
MPVLSKILGCSHEASNNLNTHLTEGQHCSLTSVSHEDKHHGDRRELSLVSILRIKWCLSKCFYNLKTIISLIILTYDFERHGTSLLLIQYCKDCKGF